MNKCKDCIYWESSDKKKPLAWGHCKYFDHFDLQPLPIWIRPQVVNLVADGGYMSPTQENCRTFKDKNSKPFRGTVDLLG